ncbi:toll/interleukin-1 receptor domain-containing protein [Paenibacillus odorifer]|uniref:toll/interleukin-1 receptor domain-containing protein n=1 Tax=Paenibacillus odorifer TaxID=189426 RepID=UPI00096BD86F|nr:toll/interleukin-1 receptor domain-containing protein [Paenibacillus odorifer]OME19935.1 hypothetical protein BSK57_23490 [Paenibacillus odorifer]
MVSQHKTVFLSYSWDSLEHQQWVYDLMQDLRKNGIDASIDITITQTQTTNLNVMMIQNMRDRDFVIFVLTEKYAQKADALAGGVGFETILSLETLKNNPDKFIFIGRGQGNFNKMLPFHLQGYNVIDFSDSDAYAEALEKLVYRIHGVPLLEVEPLGNVPNLKPRSLVAKRIEKETSFADFNIPNLRENTDLDRDHFIRKSYNEIVELLEELLNQVREKNPNFLFENDKISEKKNVFSLYVNGQQKASLKIWRDRFFSSGYDQIFLFYGRSYSNDDNAHNETIVCNEDHEKRMTLKMNFSGFGNQQDSLSPRQVVEGIWKHHLAPSLQN